MLTKFITVLSFAIGLTLTASPQRQPVEDIRSNVSNKSNFSLNKLYFLEDELNLLEFSAINSSSFEDKFQQIDSQSMNKIALGISNSSWWFRLHLSSEARLPATHYLTINFSLLEEVEIYIPDREGGFIVRRSGIAEEDESSCWQARVPTFPLINMPVDPVLYLKVKSKSPILVPMRIQCAQEYFSSALANNLFFGMFFGIIFLVICYNLILSIITKEFIYFHYLIYVFCLSIVLLNYYGFAYQYLWSGCSAWVDKIMPGSILLVALAMINFIRRFLEVKSNFPAIDKLFRFYMVAYVVLIPSAFFIPTSYLFMLLAPTSSILIVMLVIILIKSRQKNFTPANYILIGWIFLFIGTISLVGKTFGLIPNTAFTSFAILIGAVIEVIMFTVGIGYRFQWFKKESQRLMQALKLKHSEIESLREEIANHIMGSSSEAAQLSLTISKAEINNYLLNKLTERELEVLYKVAKGLANKEIGEQLFISTHTVRAHMRKIYDKLHVKNRTEAVFKAKKLHLITV